MTQISISTTDSLKKNHLNGLLQHALERESSLLHQAAERTQQRLSDYEKKHSLSTQEFFTRFTTGKMSDEDDFIDWAGEYQLYINIQQQLASLEDVVVCS
ncbi:MAG: hypothetical protein HYZ34_10635 [Ignavibacteriae bacterium]|nr:hypothetical protein [Ignavibacteriota bacterium]